MKKVKLIDVVTLAVALSEQGTKKHQKKRGINLTLKLSDIAKWNETTARKDIL